MAILAAGVRYDPQNKSVQAVIVITDADGQGKPEDLTAHKLQAAQIGHGWLDIPVQVYAAFTSPADLAAHVTQALPAVVGAATA